MAKSISTSRALTEAEITRMMLYSSLFLGKTTVEPDTGVIAAGGSVEITVTIDANALEVGDYEVTVTISCNDPFTSMTRVPMRVTVTPATGGDEDLASIRQFVLHQNYPNPFNPSTVIRFGLPQRSIVRLSVFNSLGQEVAVLVAGEQDAGYHEVRFDGMGLSSGMYFYRLQTGDFVQTRKLLLLK